MSMFHVYRPRRYNPKRSWPGGRVGFAPEERPGSTGKRWWITSTRSDPQESATESKPPLAEPGGKGERVR